MADFFEITLRNYSGLSSETKPTLLAGDVVFNGSRWREVDTDKIFIFNKADDAWYQIDTRLTMSKDMEGGGKMSVGTTPVEVTFSGYTASIIISADIDNDGTLYIGKSNVSSSGANAIVFLESGESVNIEYEDSINAVYVVASIASQYFFKGALI